MTRRLFILLGLVAFSAPIQQTQPFKFPLKPGSVRFAVIGDMGTGEAPQYQVAQQMVDARQSFRFEFVIMLGDNIYGGNRPRDFETKFELPYKALLDSGVKFYASLGNHDGPAERSYKLFNMNGANYYAFTKGNARFFALDSNYMDPKQLSWLQSQLLDAAGSDWKICFFHHPLYSSARAHGAATDLRLLLEPLFVQFGVNVVLAGHEHVYEHIKPQHGINYFTEGSSGQLRRGNLKPDSTMEKGFDSDNAFMLVEIAGDEMYFEVISRTGEIVDSGVIPRTAQKIPAAAILMDQRRPSSPLISSFLRPPTRASGRPLSVTATATMISFARGASLMRTSMPSK
jgi:predicted MPP superfamily phosphohydrolase